MEPFQKLAQMLLDHVDGILNYCRTKVRLGVVEAVNGNIKSLVRRGRGYQNLRYLLLKAQRMAATRTEFVVFRRAVPDGRSGHQIKAEEFATKEERAGKLSPSQAARNRAKAKGLLGN